MRVAVVHGVLRGGAARRLGGTVTALAGRADVELREFAFPGSTSVHPDSEQPVWSAQAPSRPRAVRPYWRYRDAASRRAAWADLWARVNRWGPDVVFANPCASPGGAPPGLRGAAAPVLYYCDEPRRVDYERRAARASNPLTRLPYLPMRRLERRDERDSVAAADRLATNSSFTAAKIRAAYDRPAEVITPGIAAVFGAPTGPMDVALRRHVLSVGALIPSKGHDLVLGAAAASGLGRPVVVIAPRPDPGEEARLRAIAAGHGLELDIRVGISDPELADLYRTAFATLYLAREEPLGLVSLESQACGTPVVVADDGGLVETVTDGGSGCVVARTAPAAAQALRALTDPTTWHALAVGAAARPVPRDADSASAVLHALEGIAATTRVGG